MIKCYQCGWEGEEDQLKEVPGNLIFYDHVAVNTLGVEITRTNHLCPTCGEILRSHRKMGGMVMDQGI